MGSSVVYKRNDDTVLSELKMKKGAINFGLGAGYSIKEKVSLEVRYHTNRQILPGYVFASTDYSSLNLILGIKLF